jgi:hypothetical protein
LQDGSSELTRGASPPTIDLVIVYNKTTSPFLELPFARRPAEEESSAKTLIAGAEVRVFSAIEANGAILIEDEKDPRLLWLERKAL